MNVFLSFLVSAVDHLPKAALATLARKLLAALAPKIEGATTNQIVHEGEVFAFAELDALLAKIEMTGIPAPQ